jgi:hypothetical protein
MIRKIEFAFEHPLMTIKYLITRDKRVLYDALRVETIAIVLKNLFHSENETKKAKVFIRVIRT